MKKKRSHQKCAEESGEGLVSEIIEGVVLCVLLVLLAKWIDKTNVGEQFGLFSYRVLQGQLIPSPPVVSVVDIGNIPPGPNGVTPRSAIKEILIALTRLPKKPKAIGVDIDFSPDVDAEQRIGDYMWKGDPQFFAFCSKLSLSVPVYLGIFRTALLPPEEWLGPPSPDPKLNIQKLAAALWIPVETENVASSIAPSDALPSQWEKARTLSSAMAKNLQGDDFGFWGKIRNTLASKSSATSLEDGLEVKLNEEKVDYSLYREERLPIIRINPEMLDDPNALRSVFASQPESIDGKLIFVGDVTKPSDVFVNPAEGKRVPGVIIQALAAQTMATRPLYSFRPWLQDSLDLALALAIFTAWILVKHFNHKRDEAGRLLSPLIIAAVIAVIAFALLVNRTRILWDDFLIVALGLAIHPLSHRTVQRCKRMRRTLWTTYLGDSK